jgi:hypothetical protein
MSLLPSSTYAGPEENLYLPATGSLQGPLTVVGDLTVTGTTFTPLLKAPTAQTTPLSIDGSVHGISMIGGGGNSSLALSDEGNANLAGNLVTLRAGSATAELAMSTNASLNVSDPTATVRVSKNGVTGSRFYVGADNTITMGTAGEAISILQGPGLSGGPALIMSNNVTMASKRDDTSFLALITSNQFNLRYVAPTGSTIPTTTSINMAPGGGLFLCSGLQCEGSFNAPLEVGAGTTMTLNKGFYTTAQPICGMIWPSNFQVGTPPSGLPSAGRAYAIWRGTGAGTFSPLTTVENQNGVVFTFTPGTRNYFQIIVL